MAKRKLTPSLKEKIKKDYARLKQADYDGEALAYLKQVRGGHRGRVSQRKAKEKKVEKIKKAIPARADKNTNKGVKVGDRFIPKGSSAYIVIEASAKNLGVSVSKFVKMHKDNIEQLLKDYFIFARKEIDDLILLIKEVPVKVHSPIKGRVIKPSTASFNLHSIKKALIEMCGVYPYIFIEYAFDLEGAMHFNCPRPGEYVEMDCEELKEFLEDRYTNITWIDHDNPK
jgi:hypothetical protein